MSSIEQFLTAVFELRPSRRKAAAMERVRAAAEDVFWQVLDQHRPMAEAAVGAAKDERRKAIADVEAAGLRAAGSAGLAEPVAKGLGRDIAAAAASFIGLRSKDLPAEWPTRSVVQEHDFEAALDAFPTAFTKDEEDDARDELSRVARSCGP
jgi:hypothetical protein